MKTPEVKIIVQKLIKYLNVDIEYVFSNSKQILFFKISYYSYDICSVIVKYTKVTRGCFKRNYYYEP